MKRAHVPRHWRRAMTASAVAMIFGLPVVGFAMAPSARADDSPGANLAGIGASAYASAVQVSPLTPGVVGAGNVSQGNLVAAEIPYASASTSTGPSSSSTASPAYPGDTAAGAGNDIGTFAPQFPAALANALNDPVVARADYPAQVSVGSSYNYSPPGGSTTGVGEASANATESGATSQSATSSQSFADQAVTIGSSTAKSATQLGASSVLGTSHTDVGTIDILGVVKIAGITSDASASSDGNLGQPSSSFALGAVTVAGQPASIGPNGITLTSTSQGSLIVPDANQALLAVQQAGISIHTVAPVSTTNGAQATVTSGGLVIAFQDANIPNPNGSVPVSDVGLDLNLGISQATADATTLPAFTPFPSTGLGSGTGLVTTGSGTTGVVSPAVSGASSVATTGGSSLGSVATPSLAPSTPSAVSTGSHQTTQPTAPVASPPATLLGAPIKVAWVVIAFLLSLVVAGPLLGYANWQLLRGRKS